MNVHPLSTRELNRKVISIAVSWSSSRNTVPRCVVAGETSRITTKWAQSTHDEGLQERYFGPLAIRRIASFVRTVVFGIRSSQIIRFRRSRIDSLISVDPS